MRTFQSFLLSVILLVVPAQAIAARVRLNHTTHAHHAAGRSSHFGVASWYGPEIRKHGAHRNHYRRMANGAFFDPRKMTAASRTLPLGSHVRVTNLSTGMTVRVEVTDRGPFAGHRILDLAEAAAEKIHCKGLCQVYIDWSHAKFDPEIPDPTGLPLFASTRAVPQESNP